MSFFTIVIPLFNKECFIKQTLECIINQSFTDFEVIIVNDGSTDRSLEKTKKYIDNRFKIITQKNQGASYARNQGIKEAQGKYIALLDADDFWYKDHLLELKKLIEIFPNAGLFCNNYEINYNNHHVKPPNFNFKHNNNPLIINDYFRSSMINSIAWTSSVSFTKAYFDKIGKYNLKLRTGQDIDLWIRFAIKYSVAFNPKITMTYNNFDTNSLSKSKYNNDRYDLINNYSKEEKNNKSLKKYLDMNRYALAIRCLLNDENNLYKKLKKEIDYNSLNFKQKTLLFFPKFLLLLVKRFQKILIKNKIYITAYN